MKDNQQILLKRYIYKNNNLTYFLIFYVSNDRITKKKRVTP